MGRYKEGFRVRDRITNAADSVTATSEQFGATMVKASDTMVILQIVSLAAIAIAVIAVIIATKGSKS